MSDEGIKIIKHDNEEKLLRSGVKQAGEKVS